MKWLDSQISYKEPKQQRFTQPAQTNTTVLSSIETKLNPYGFIYVPKKVLSSLPFKIDDRLRLRIDKVNGSVIITQSKKAEDQ